MANMFMLLKVRIVLVCQFIANDSSTRTALMSQSCMRCVLNLFFNYARHEKVQLFLETLDAIKTIYIVSLKLML